MELVLLTPKGEEYKEKLGFKLDEYSCKIRRSYRYGIRHGGPEVRKLRRNFPYAMARRYEVLSDVDDGVSVEHRLDSIRYSLASSSVRSSYKGKMESSLRLGEKRLVGFLTEMLTEQPVPSAVAYERSYRRTLKNLIDKGYIEVVKPDKETRLYYVEIEPTDGIILSAGSRKEAKEKASRMYPECADVPDYEVTEVSPEWESKIAQGYGEEALTSAAEGATYIHNRGFELVPFQVFRRR